MRIRVISVGDVDYEVCNYVSRVDTAQTHGWTVRVPAGLGSASKYFGDKVSVLQSLREAMQFVHDNVVLVRPAREKEPACKKIKTGVRGISVHRVEKGKHSQIMVNVKDPIDLGTKSFHVGVESKVTQEKLDQKLAEAARWLESRIELIPDKWEQRTQDFKTHVLTLMERL